MADSNPDKAPPSAASSGAGFLKALRTLSVVEGVSTLVLFGIAMPLKYIADMPMAVRIVGSLHGFLFVSLALMLGAGVRRVSMPKSMAVVGIVAAVFPFGPFWFDRQLQQLEPENPDS